MKTCSKCKTYAIEAQTYCIYCGNIHFIEDEPNKSPIVKSESENRLELATEDSE